MRTLAASTPLPLRQGTPAWVDARRDFIGSSDIPVITGNSPYRTSAFDLWAYKTRLVTPEPVRPETQELFDLGHAMEPVIADRYRAITGRPVRRVNRMLASKSIPWASASLDRVSALRGERRIVELKWSPYGRRWGDGPEPVPAHVQDQVQWQLMVTRFDVAEVAVLAGSHVEVHLVEPDASYQADLLYLARWFHELVEKGEAPTVDGTEATRRALSRLYPVDDGTMLAPTPELVALLQEYAPAEQAAKAATLEFDRIANAIRSALGEHAGSESEAWRVTWKKTKDSLRIDWQEVAIEYLDALRQHGPMTDDQVTAYAAEVIDRHTETKDGPRRLSVWFKKNGGDTSWT